MLVSRVENDVGPQTEDPSVLAKAKTNLHNDKFKEPKYSNGGFQCPSGAQERLQNVERHLGMETNTGDVLSRLKAIEDRILFLESISPEYFTLKTVSRYSITLVRGNLNLNLKNYKPHMRQW